MRRSIRCRHGFDRELVDCPACGDKGSLERHEALLARNHKRKYRLRALAKRQQVNQ